MNKCIGPEECESVSYTISQSYSEFPTEIYAQSVYYDNPNLQSLFVNLTTDEQKLAKIKKNVMQINFYYDQLSYTLIEERPKVELVRLLFVCRRLVCNCSHHSSAIVFINRLM
jgi:hypothetical protein